MSRVIDEIAAERRRQIEVEGFTSEHDDEHQRGEIAAAAAAYAEMATADRDYEDGWIVYPDGIRSITVTPPSIWRWEWKWWKPKNRRADLIRAGALIVAEIERLDRIETAPRTVDRFAAGFREGVMAAAALLRGRAETDHFPGEVTDDQPYETLICDARKIEALAAEVRP